MGHRARVCQRHDFQESDSRLTRHRPMWLAPTDRLGTRVAIISPINRLNQQNQLSATLRKTHRNYTREGGRRMPAATPGVLLILGAICIGVVLLAVVVIFVVFVPRTTRMGERDSDQ
jgi:hypothetical protein